MLKWPLGQELQQIRAGLGLVRTQIILCKAARGNLSSVYVGSANSSGCKAARCHKFTILMRICSVFFVLSVPKKLAPISPVKLKTLFLS